MSAVYLRSFLEAVELMPTDIQPDFTELRQLDQECRAIVTKVTAILQPAGETGSAPSTSRAGSNVSGTQQVNCEPLLKRLAELHRLKKAASERISKEVQKQLDSLATDKQQYESGEYKLKTKERMTEAPVPDVEMQSAGEDDLEEEEPAPPPAISHHAAATSHRAAAASSGGGGGATATTHATGSGSSRTAGAQASGGAQATNSKKRKRKGGSGSRKQKSEPRYCVPGCQLITGNMVGCDNDNCENGQWFHYECVGLKGAPTTKNWFCPACRAALKGSKGSK